MIKHGESINGKYSRLWGIWQGMKVRTTNLNHKDYKYYGAKGIKLCKEWHNSSVFFLWAKENGYSDILEIDRIDGSKGYCPNNCRWVTRRDNIMNRPHKEDWGVYFNGNVWFVRIRRYKKFYYGGCHKDKNEAIKLRDILLHKLDKL